MEYYPKVIKNREFKEIASDFTNPLDAVREAISNALDAGATEITITAESKEINFQRKLVLTFEDNGCGMNLEKLQAFFDLGNSKWNNKHRETYGEKGHGTKVYYHSEKLTVETINNNGEKYIGDVDTPWLTLKKGDDLKTKITGPTKLSGQSKTGTKIIVIGFFENKLEPFRHENMKDFIKWFSAFGSIKIYFDDKNTNRPKLIIKGVDSNITEEIKFGHLFPDENYNFENIREQINNGTLKGNATDYFCKRWTMEKTVLYETVKTQIQIIFAIEGEKIRIIPKGVSATDRYGLWLAKNGIPIERRNDWLFPDKAIWTQFHIIANCDDFHLTANRGSVGNSDPEILEGIKKTVKTFYEEVQKDKLYQLWEKSKEAEVLEAKKEKEFAKLKERLKKIDKRENIKEIQEIRILKPRDEAETLHLLSNLILLNKLGKKDIKELDFEILDVETGVGIDLIVSWRDPRTRSETNKIIEVEHKLDSFTKHKHFFKQVHAIICWEKGQISLGTEIIDWDDNKYEFKKTGDKYFFQSKSGTDVIEVYILSEIINRLRDK